MKNSTKGVIFILLLGLGLPLSAQVDRSGLLQQYEEVSYYSEKRIAVKQNGKWGFLDESGKKVVNFLYDAVYFFREGMAGVRKGGRFNGKEGFIDKYGKTVAPIIYNKVSNFSEGVAAVQKGGVWGYINKQNEEVIPFRFSAADEMASGMARVREDGKMGLINRQGFYLFMPQYQDIKVTHKSILLKKDDEWVEAPLSNIMKYAVEGYVHYKLEQEKKKAVEDLLQWQEKGEFEKNKKYTERIKRLSKKMGDEQERMQKKARELQQEAYNYYARTFDKSINWKHITLEEYDSENESFKVRVDGKASFVLRVPISLAPSFRKKQEKIQIKDRDYVLTSSGWVLSRAEIVYGRSARINYDQTKESGYDPTAKTPVDIMIPELRVQNQQDQFVNTFVHNVEDNLPQTITDNKQSVAVLIGNRDYINMKRRPYAINDAHSMKRHLIASLNYQESNVIEKTNLSLAGFYELFGSEENHKGQLYNFIAPDTKKVFVFYAGNTAHEGQSEIDFFVPIDGSDKNPSISCFSTEVFQRNLSLLGVEEIIIVVDAGFEFNQQVKNVDKPGGVLLLKNQLFVNNGTIFMATDKPKTIQDHTGSKHGLFTFLFLRGLHNARADKDKNGKLSFQEMIDHINDEQEGLPYESKRNENEEQRATLDTPNPKGILAVYP